MVIREGQKQRRGVLGGAKTGEEGLDGIKQFWGSKQGAKIRRVCRKVSRQQGSDFGRGLATRKALGKKKRRKERERRKSPSGASHHKAVCME